MATSNVLQVMSPTTGTVAMTDDDIGASPQRRAVDAPMALALARDSTEADTHSSGLVFHRSKSRRTANTERYTPYESPYGGARPSLTTRRAAGSARVPTQDSTFNNAQEASPSKEDVKRNLQEVLRQLGVVKEDARAACHRVLESQQQEFRECAHRFSQERDQINAAELSQQRHSLTTEFGRSLESMTTRSNAVLDAQRNKFLSETDSQLLSQFHELNVQGIRICQEH